MLNVDSINAVIRGVSVITRGAARGHDLEIDHKTLTQMLDRAQVRGQVPVKVDHKSGAAAVCGYLTNFAINGAKLTADWFLMKSHPLTPQILETAERMPSCIGLSAAFIEPERTERGKARVEELISVDYVATPAANPSGLFASRVERIEFSRRKVARVLARGTPAIHRVIDATKENIRVTRPDLPGEEQVKTVARGLKESPAARAAALRLAKAGVGAGVGGYIGYRAHGKRGVKAGAKAGAIAGLLFSTPEPRNAVRAGVMLAAKLNFA